METHVSWANVMIPCGLSLGATVTSAMVLSPREGGIPEVTLPTKVTEVNSTKNTSSSSGTSSWVKKVMSNHVHCAPSE